MGDPYLPFYVDAWRSEERLADVSLAARGLWIEMMALMHRADPRGYLVVSGRRLTLDDHVTIARQARAPEALTRKLLDELHAAGVFSIANDGTLYSRRMVRDTERRAQAKEWGKRGGSPTLKGGVNPQDNDSLKGGVNPQDKATLKPNARAHLASLGLEESDVSTLVEMSPAVALGVWFVIAGVKAGVIPGHHRFSAERIAQNHLEALHSLLATYEIAEIKARALRFFARKASDGPNRLIADVTLKFFSEHWDWFAEDSTRRQESGRGTADDDHVAAQLRAMVT